MTLFYYAKEIETSQGNLRFSLPPTSIFILAVIPVLTVIPVIQGLHTTCPRLSHLPVPSTLLPSQEPHFNMFFCPYLLWLFSMGTDTCSKI